MHVVEAEAALDAEPVLVGWAVLAGDVEKLVVFDVIGELTADTTIRTHAVDRPVGFSRKDIALVHQRRWHQRTGGTGLHAFATGDASRSAHRIVKVEHDFLAVTATGHADHIVDLDFAAGAHTQVAMNAGVEIDRHRRVRTIRLRRFTAWKTARRDLKAGRDLPQFGIRIVRQLAYRLIGEQKLGDHSSRRLGAIGLRAHLHARRGHPNAACRQHPLAFDLDHADAAIAVGPIAWLGQIAQMRQLDAEPARSVENRLALANIDLAIVDRESLGDGFGSRIRRADHWRLMGDMHAALALDRAAGGAFLVVPVTARLLLVVIVHGADLALPMSQRFGQFIRKIP